MDLENTLLAQGDTRQVCRDVDAAGQAAAAAEWSPWEPTPDKDVICDAGQVIVVPTPEDGQRVFVALDERGKIQFEFDPREATRTTQFGDLVLEIDQGEVVIRDYLDALVSGNVPELAGPNDIPIDPQGLLVEPAAGTPTDPGSPGANADGPIGPANEGQFFAGAQPQSSLGGLDYAGVIDPTSLSYRLFGPTVDLFVPAGGTSGDGPDLGPPDAVDDNKSTGLGTPVVIPVLDNDSDPDNDPLTIIGFTPPAHGTVTKNDDGTFTYTPDKDYAGPDSFTYTISDGKGGTDTATVNLTVEPTQGPPDAVNDSKTTDEDTPVVIPVLDNDSDPDNDPLIITEFTQPGHGTVTKNDDGTFTYTPDKDYNGPDSFTYTISDGKGGTDTATVNLTVNPADDAPTAENDENNTQGQVATTNLVIVFDRSSSMLQNPDVPGFATRLDLAKDAVAKLLEAYAGNGPINVLIVDFAASASTSGWLTGDNAVDQGTGYVNGLATSGGTNYLAAINTLQTTYPIGTPAADNSIVYFISDGEPAPSNTSLGANGAVPAWEAFLADNDIDTAFAVGINSNRQDLDRQALEDVAFPNTPNDNNPILITDEGEIRNILIDTVPPPPVTGDVDANDDFGGDGPGFIRSLEVDGTTYTFDPTAQTITGSGQTIAGSVLDVTTDLGGKLTFNFADGTYSYAPPKVQASEQEVFTYTIEDSNGSPDSATLTINVRRATDRPPVTFAQDVLVPDDPSQVPSEFPGAGYPLLATAPDDLDGDQLTIRITEVPADGEILNGGTAVAVGTELTIAEFQGLRYRPDGDGVEETMTLRYEVSDGTNMTAGIVTIGTVVGAPVSIQGGAEPESIFGTSGSDTLDGGGETDQVVGGAGDDSMSGGAGTDRLLGGAGNDTLDGGAGDDSLAGNDGNDVIVASLGNDVINGGSGFDVLDFSKAAGAVIVDFNGGTISGLGSGSFGGIEGVIGGSAGDKISGGNGSEQLAGGAGNDTLNGRSGNDSLIGGEGKDLLDASQGNDVITFLAVSDSGDSIVGFDVNASGGQDVIDLGALFDDLGVAQADRAGRISFVDTGTDVDLRIDADGDSANGAELTLLTLVGLANVSGLAVGEDVIVGS